MKRGRTSLAELSVVSIDATTKPIEPPEFLTPKEAKLFREVVASVSPKHFVPSDAHLLATFVQVTLTGREAIKGLPDTIGIWDRCVKTQAILATKLRLAPQSRLDQRAAGRSTREMPTKTPWD
jgi:hypothetical protein